MNFKNKFLIVVASLLLGNAMHATKSEPQSLSEAIKVISEIASTTPNVADQLSGRDPQAFTDEELLAFIKTVSATCSANLSQEDAAKLTLAQTMLVELLKKFKVSGFSFCTDLNGAFFWDNQDPKFTVCYKDDQGKFKERTYQASIDSIGLKIQLALKFNLVFFVGTDLNFYDSKKTIELGRGVEFSLPFLTTLAQKLGFKNSKEIYRVIDEDDRNRRLNEDYEPGTELVLEVPFNLNLNLDPEVTIVSFKGMSGALVIVGYGLGLGNGALFTIVPSISGGGFDNATLFTRIPSFSYVKGGTLKPEFNK